MMLDRLIGRTVGSGPIDLGSSPSLASCYVGFLIIKLFNAWGKS